MKGFSPEMVSWSVIPVVGSSAAGKGVFTEVFTEEIVRLGGVVVGGESGKHFRNLKKPVGSVVDVGTVSRRGQIETIPYVMPKMNGNDSNQADKGEMVETLYGIFPQMAAFFSQANIWLESGEHVAIVMDGFVRLGAYKHKDQEIPHQVDQIAQAWSQAYKNNGKDVSQHDLSAALFQANYVLVDAPIQKCEELMVGRIEKEIARVDDNRALVAASIEILRGIVEGDVHDSELSLVLQTLKSCGIDLNVRTDDAKHSARKARLRAWQLVEEVNDRKTYHAGVVARTAIDLGYEMLVDDGSFVSTRTNTSVISNRGSFEQLNENARSWARQWMDKRNSH